MPSNIEITRRVFAAFGAGDVDAILDFLHADVVIEFYGPETIPYAGHYPGKQEARRFFEIVLRSVDVNEFTPVEFFADRNNVVVTGHLDLTAKGTGARFESEFVHVIALKDGKWLRFRDFMDTAAAVAAFGG